MVFVVPVRDGDYLLVLCTFFATIGPWRPATRILSFIRNVQGVRRGTDNADEW